MKFVKGISLFFIIPVLIFVMGFFLGGKFSSFFYPGARSRQIYLQEEIQETPEENRQAAEEEEEPDRKQTPSAADSAAIVQEEDGTTKKFRAASALDEQKIDADTKFMVEEADLRRDTIVETQWKLPEKYIGMNREEFLKAMEEYELSPPLTELERGFVSLEVKSFSGDKILVRMNYIYTAPSNSFYLRAENHYVVVYCDDQKTVYMKTNILLEDLPDDIQQEIIGEMHVEDEKTLYDFLESYSS